MRHIRSEYEFNEFYKVLKKRGEFDVEILATVTKILQGVKERGDAEVRELTRLFDGITLDSFRLSQDTIDEYAARVDDGFLEALKMSYRRINVYHRRQVDSSWSFEDGHGVFGQVIRPLHRVGLYVPGGKAAYPSTVLMNAVAAQVAGVREIALCVPTPHGEINPHVMAAIKLTGITEVYRIGGAQAIAAMAFGTESIKGVDKIVGPGNIYVALAKKLVFGTVDIDMIAGPSEILIVADQSANPVFIAADLLSQAEHDEMASSVLITTSETLAQSVAEELQRQLAALTRKEIASASLSAFGAIIVVESTEKAFDYVNRIAPEHLEIMTEEPENKLPLIQNAGAIFLGQWSAEVIGDYAAGPNHTLPTGGSARFFSPLGVYDFIKRSSLINLSRNGFNALAAETQLLAQTEGLQGHANAVKVRREDISPG
ncbi:MAG: histidinol dehydrogenase [Nitrospirae bacterium]|uniref:histidinol dehydrogenase n=1 Tax=Candidatus Magnetobacterium casense TaxID=1455061 RepID=UPI00058FDEE6|nr:histidinol dehydrogenase [Candidatus Magnetobacterium casensis]MBF0338403.1 histidinol dehydrogenase [Nitrospirota bacterium]